MAEISKPVNLSLTWASTGDILDPGDSKYAQGWEVEIPPRQWFNFYQNRVDNAIAHINQHGWAVWDDSTEYQANKSYVQGSTGNLYRALTTNTNIDPVSDAGTNWQALFITRLATTVEAQAWSSNTTSLSPLRLNDAFKGSNQSLTSSGFQKLPGGLIKQWGTTGTIAAGASLVVVFPVAFPSGAFVVNINGGSNTDSTTPVSFAYSLIDNTSVTLRNRSTVGVTANWTAVGS
ncbi:hypothetical protein D3C85_1082870 [compost metagenome]